MSKTDFLDTQRSAVNVEEVKEVHLLMFGRQPMSSISSWHPSTRSLMNLSVRESPMSSQLRFYRVTSHISHIGHKTHSYRDEHSHSGPWSQVCIVGGGVTSAVSPCPELTHARPQSPANWHLLGGKFRGQIMLSPDTLPHGAGLGCDYSVSVDTISTAQILTARAALIWVGVAPWQCFVGTIYFLLEDWYNPLLFSRAWGYGV